MILTLIIQQKLKYIFKLSAKVNHAVLKIIKIRRESIIVFRMGSANGIEWTGT